jgi:predicted nucleic acid-binding protein
MAASVYIESSIISYLTSRPSRDLVTAGRQAITSEWWLKSKKEYEVYISALVEEEIAGGDPMAAAKRLESVADIPSILITSEAQSLAEALVASKAVPDNSVRDALHIAIAATQGIEYLLTWNFKHINNAETKALIARVVEGDGWACPVLCSPEELGSIDYEE